MAYLTIEWSWGAYLAAIYVVGATANHSLFLAIHELSHNLGFKSVSNNKLLAMAANLAIGIPYCITFKPYHMEHHRYQVTHMDFLSYRSRIVLRIVSADYNCVCMCVLVQGEAGVDTDIPTYLECWFITSTSMSYVDHTFKKAVFMFFQIFAYAFRYVCVCVRVCAYTRMHTFECICV